MFWEKNTFWKLSWSVCIVGKRRGVRPAHRWNKRRAGGNLGFVILYLSHLLSSGIQNIRGVWDPGDKPEDYLGRLDLWSCTDTTSPNVLLALLVSDLPPLFTAQPLWSTSPPLKLQAFFCAHTVCIQARHCIAHLCVSVYSVSLGSCRQHIRENGNQTLSSDSCVLLLNLPHVVW